MPSEDHLYIYHKGGSANQVEETILNKLRETRKIEPRFNIVNDQHLGITIEAARLEIELFDKVYRLFQELAKVTNHDFVLGRMNKGRTQSEDVLNITAREPDSLVRAFQI